MKVRLSKPLCDYIPRYTNTEQKNELSLYFKKTHFKVSLFWSAGNF